MGKIVLMIVIYFHDLAVAILFSNVIVVHLVGRYVDSHGGPEKLVGALFTRLARITYAVLAYVILGGAVRAYYFMDFEWNPAVGRGQVTALIVKHVFLVVLTIVGLLGHRRYVKRYGTGR